LFWTADITQDGTIFPPIRMDSGAAAMKKNHFDSINPKGSKQFNSLLAMLPAVAELRADHGVVLFEKARLSKFGEF
jgi:hypothetical protein